MSALPRLEDLCPSPGLDKTAAPLITPRPDQLEALDAILDALDRGVRRPLVEAPCAWGKSVLIAMLALALVRRGRRVLILAHRHELLEQNTGALLRLDPAADVGICSASLRSDRLDAAIVVGGTATIFRRLQRLGRVDAVLLDEAHLLGPGSTSMLGTILKSLGDPPLIGFTATPYRTDCGSLISAELFDEIVWRMGVIEAIDAGLLVPLVTKSPKAGRIDTTCVPIERGEFQQRPLEQAALTGSVTRDAVVRTLQVAAEENRHGAAVLRHRRRALRGDQCGAARTGHRPRRHHRRDAHRRTRRGHRPLSRRRAAGVGQLQRADHRLRCPQHRPASRSCGRPCRRCFGRRLPAEACARGLGRPTAACSTSAGTSCATARSTRSSCGRRVRATTPRPPQTACGSARAATRSTRSPRPSCTSCGMVLIKPRVSTITTIESTAPAIDAQAERPALGPRPHDARRHP